MDELKLENFFEKDKSGRVVRKGDLDLFLLYMATKIDEIARSIHKI